MRAKNTRVISVPCQNFIITALTIGRLHEKLQQIRGLDKKYNPTEQRKRDEEHKRTEQQAREETQRTARKQQLSRTKHIDHSWKLGR